MIRVTYEKNFNEEEITVVSNEAETNANLVGLFFRNQKKEFQVDKLVVTPEFLKEFGKACRLDKRIGAIKAVRAEFGWSLKESKCFIDEVLPYLQDDHLI